MQNLLISNLVYFFKEQKDFFWFHVSSYCLAGFLFIDVIAANKSQDVVFLLWMLLGHPKTFGWKNVAPFHFTHKHVSSLTLFWRRFDGPQAILSRMQTNTIFSTSSNWPNSVDLYYGRTLFNFWTDRPDIPRPDLRTNKPPPQSNRVSRHRRSGSDHLDWVEEVGDLVDVCTFCSRKLLLFPVIKHHIFHFSSEASAYNPVCVVALWGPHPFRQEDTIWPAFKQPAIVRCVCVWCFWAGLSENVLILS